MRSDERQQLQQQWPFRVMVIVIILRVLTLVVIAILDIERTTVKKTEMIIIKRKTRHVARSAVVEVVWQCGGLVVSCGGNVVLVLVLVLAPALALALVLVWYWCVVLVCVCVCVCVRWCGAFVVLVWWEEE